MGPVSGTGRAMMASLQQAISKGMPPDQAIQYVKGMATQGVAPLTDLYSMLNQFQRLKQQQVKPPQTPPTIKDQLNMLDQQQQMQPQQGNIQQMQAGAPAPQPMDRGLGAIDAGRMEYPQFAGGGIVAFAGGGDVIHMADGPPPSMFDNAIGAVKDFADPYIDTAKDFGSAYMTALRNPFGSIASTEVAESLSKSPEFSNEDILVELRTALLKGDKARAEQLGSAYLERNRRDLMSAQKDLRQLREQVIGEQNSRTATSFMRPKVDTPPPAPPRTGVQLGGGDYGDFDRGRKILSDIETQLKPAAEKTVEQNLADIEALQKKQGIGEASRKQGEYLTKREAEAAKDLANDKRMALAQAGFAMAEAASRRGRERTGFLGAAAIGGTTGTKLYQAALKENRALKDSIAQNRFALEQADELRKAGNIRDANALEKEAKSNLRSLNLARAQNETAIAEFQGRERGQDRRTGAQIAAEKERYGAARDLKRDEMLIELVKSGYLTGDSDQAKQLRSLIMNNLGVDVGDQVQIDLAKYGL